MESALGQAPRKVVGKPMPLIDGLDKVTGRGKYSADIQFPDALVGRILRSPHAHARILSVDTSEALPYERKVRETAYLALRTSEGIVPARFQRDTGADPWAFFEDELARLIELGLVEEKRGRIRLSGRGVSVADAVAVEIL